MQGVGCLQHLAAAARQGGARKGRVRHPRGGVARALANRDVDFQGEHGAEVAPEDREGDAAKDGAVLRLDAEQREIVVVHRHGHGRLIAGACFSFRKSDFRFRVDSRAHFCSGFV